MRDFAALYDALDASTATGTKHAALVQGLRALPAADAAWAVHLLSGGKLARVARSGELRRWLQEASGLPDWLIEDSYAHVGDLAETIALLLPEDHAPAEDTGSEPGLATEIERLRTVVGADEPCRRAAVVAGWRRWQGSARFVYTKLLTGGLRVGVSSGLVQKALAEIAGVDSATMAARLVGGFVPSAEVWARLVASTEAEDAAIDSADAGASRIDRPYPFHLASPFEGAPEGLGPITDFQIEWKWDGIRAQLLRRGGRVLLWSRGEERLDGRFPEVEAAALALPEGTVLDGEVLAWGEGVPRPFAALQTRIQRQRPGPKVLAATPVRFMAFDLLEADGVDVREWPLCQRRERMAAVLDGAPPTLGVSPALQAADWPAAAALRAMAREQQAEGLMLKHREGRYRVGRKRGELWKWKLDPRSVDAVLLYAQAGHGRRSTLHTDCTFALWDGDALVPVAKAYSGLTDAEFLELDRWVRTHTRERFGPVRSVAPELVFEIAFEGVQASSRHKSGVAVRFPRILRWRRDKGPRDADALATLKAMIDA